MLLRTKDDVENFSTVWTSALLHDLLRDLPEEWRSGSADFIYESFDGFRSALSAWEFYDWHHALTTVFPGGCRLAHWLAAAGYAPKTWNDLAELTCLCICVPLSSHTLVQIQPIEPGDSIRISEVGES
jgi:hypothetical protein